MVRCGKPSPSLREQVAYVQSLKDSLAKMIEWARHPSPIPYIPFRADVDDAERLLKGPPCICPSHASNRGESDWDGIEDYRAAVLAAIKSDEEWSA